MIYECCKLYSFICDPDEKIWIFEFSLGVCSTELRNLVSSLEYLVSNGGQVPLGGIRLGGSATFVILETIIKMSKLHGRSSKYWAGFIWVPKLRNCMFGSLIYSSDLI